MSVAEFDSDKLNEIFKRAAKTVRAPRMEGCPGCVGVEVHGRPCEMNASYCCIAWFIAHNSGRADRHVSGTDEGAAREP